MVQTPRKLAGVLEKAARHFPAVVVTGPRRAGKTTLVRRTFPQAKYILLEDPDVQARVQSDPRAFLEEQFLCCCNEAFKRSRYSVDRLRNPGKLRFRANAQLILESFCKTAQSAPSDWPFGTNEAL